MEDPLHSLIDTDEVIKPYMGVAKDTTNVSTLRALILKVLSDSGVFAGYSDIQAVVHTHLQGAPNGEKLIDTLDLFSYGSYGDYVARPDKFLVLNDAQLFKLKQLTALGIVEEACRQKQSAVKYEAVQHALQLSNPSEVESILVSCIYSRVMTGKFCQKTKTLLLSAKNGPPVCPRDVPLSRISDLLQALQSIKMTLSECQDELTKQQTKVQKQHDRDARFNKQVQERMKIAEAVSRDMANTPMLQAQRRGSGWGNLGDAAAVFAGADDAMEFSPTARRQKRSRGGLSGLGDQSGLRFPR
jgi:COP9 signalosome complex subunit 7